MVGTETRRDGNGEPRDFSFPTAISRPFPSLVSVPAVYHPAVRRLVPVPTVSRLTVCPLPGFFPFHRLPSCSHPIPIFAHNFSHPASHYWGSYSIPFTTGFLVSPSCDHPRRIELFYATLDATTVYFLPEVFFFHFCLFSPAKKMIFSSLKLVVSVLGARLGASKVETILFLRLNKSSKDVG